MPKPSVDMHLLRCLEALVTECHVSRAADRMNMSQSGMSTALGRLRKAFNDPILVRTSKGMELSEQAFEIAGAVRRALREIDSVMETRGDFRPDEAQMTINVMASDYVGRMILPNAMERLRKEAPGISITIVSPQPNRIRESLANAEVDLVLGFYHDLADGLYQTTLSAETLACVVRENHPVTRKELTVAQYGELDHIAYAAPPSFISSVEVELKQALRPYGIRRRIATNLPSLSMMPEIVARTDLAASIPRGFAESYASRQGLAVLPFPIEMGKLPVRAIWHEKMHANRGHQWLRQVLQAAAQQAPAR